MLRVRLLGELALELDGRRLDPPVGRPARAVIAWLALHPGEHARAQVASTIWPDVLDRSARESLRTALSEVRRSLADAADALVATRESVQLAADWVDAREVERLVLSGRLDDAIALCRGDLVPGLDAQWVIDTRQAQRELHADALGRLADASTAAGDHAAAVRYARERAALDPLSEEAARTLMSALAAAGDRAAALATYERLLERLRRDLGVAPSAATRGVADELRTRDATARAPDLRPGPVTRQPRTPFVGRRVELAALRAAWSARASSLVELSGEPGVGKTRLADEFARHVHAAGGAVLLGECDEDAVVPYQPFVQALSAPQLDLGPRAVELARIIPGLGEPPRADDDRSRWRLFEAVASVLRTQAIRGGLLLVLDDLHWADPPTLRLLAHLIRRGEVVGLQVLAIYRDTELGRAHPLATTLADLRRSATAQRIDLRGLGVHEVGALIGAVTGTPASAGFAAALHAETDGNPLFVEEVALHRGGAGDAPPQGVRDAIGRRLSRLSETTNGVLAAAAVIGREIDVALLERLVDVPHHVTLDAIDEALRAQLLREAADRPGRLTFAHALVRETLYAEMSAVRRARAHRRVADAIEALHPHDAGRYAAEIAHHLYEAAPGADGERAAAYARMAGDQAMQRLAWEEAALQYARGLELLEPTGSDVSLTVCELRLARGDALMRAGDVAQARVVFAAAADDARRLGAHALLARAALGHAGVAIVISEPEPTSVALLESALTGAGDADRARLCARLAVELLYTDRPRSELLADEALAAGRRSGDRGALAYALTAIHAVCWDPDHLEERLAITDELLSLGAADREIHLTALHWRVVDLFEAGDIEGFRAAVGEHVAIADELRLAAYQWYGPLWRGVEAMLAGEHDAARRLGDEALVLGRRAGDGNAELFREMLALQELAQRGLFDRFDIEQFAARAAASPAAGAWRASLAWLLAEVGRLDEARAELRALADKGFAAAPRDVNWLITLTECGEACVLVGASEHASELYDLLAPYVERNVMGGRAVSTDGSGHRVPGLLAAVDGRLDLAVEHLTEAVTANTRMGMWPFVVRSQVQLAAVLRARGEHGDHEQAAALEVEAGARSTRLGIAPVTAPRFASG